MPRNEHQERVPQYDSVGTGEDLTGSQIMPDLQNEEYAAMGDGSSPTYVCPTPASFASRRRWIASCMRFKG